MWGNEFFEKQALRNSKRKFEEGDPLMYEYEYLLVDTYEPKE